MTQPKLSEQLRELEIEAARKTSGTHRYEFHNGKKWAFAEAASLAETWELARTHIQCAYCNLNIGDSREAYVEHDAVCERNPLVAKVRELEAKLKRTGSWLFNIRQKLTYLKSYHKVITRSELASPMADIECAIGIVSPQDARPFNPQRYAELDQADCDKQAHTVELKKQVAHLQAQLAWTPVSDGLPTEPGRYQFVDDINFAHPDHGEFPHYWRKPKVSPTENHHWFLHDRRWFFSPLDWCRGYTYWRKVELPERRIELPEAK